MLSPLSAPNGTRRRSLLLFFFFNQISQKQFLAVLFVLSLPVSLIFANFFLHPFQTLKDHFIAGFLISLSIFVAFEAGVFFWWQGFSDSAGFLKAKSRF